MTYDGLKEHLRTHRTLKDFNLGHRLLQGLREDRFARQLRVALLTSYTADFVGPLLKVDLMLSDIRCDLYKPHFNQFRQEVIDPASGLYGFKPDIAVVGFGLEDVFSDAVSRFALMTEAERGEFANQVAALYESMGRAFRENAPASAILLLQDLVAPFNTNQSLFYNVVEKVNAELRGLATRIPGTYVMDYSRLVSECGSRSWTDPRTYYTARIPVAQANWLNLSEAYARYIRSLLHMEVKCIVLDLDNTLWGGVLGEDCIGRIQIGGTYPGNVFEGFQRYLLSLYTDGYILGIASKNNHDDVVEVLRTHPSMVLREEHFAAIKANWNSKEESIREISKEIQISFDHMLFVDDNPVEIQKVKAAIPGISCLQIESPPLNFMRQFEEHRCIGKVLVTQEDRQRGQQYFDDRRRREFKQAAETIEDFYRSLEQRLTIHTNNKKHIARIAQLTQRTNQFNMTTIRMTEAEVERLMHRDDYALITADLADRFGDSGTIAYLQVRKLGRSWDIENFLMSCRVLGRTVEESLLDYIIEKAGREGAESILASYIPTKKNAPFAEFYPRNGSVVAELGANGDKRYVNLVAEHGKRESFAEIIEREPKEIAPMDGLRAAMEGVANV